MPPAGQRCDNRGHERIPYKTGTTHFGFRDVAAKDKQKLVGEVFTSVARNYDLMNDLMSWASTGRGSATT